MKFLFNAIAIAFFICASHVEAFNENFFKIQNTELRKREFVKNMLPLIQKANEAILAEREMVDSFFTQFKKVRKLEKMDQKNIEKMLELADKYEIKSVVNEKLFKRRVAPVPPSLAITQSAIETGWGSSRFFKEANNAFGQWTYSKTNGLVPNRRDDGKTHKIRVFNSVQDSVHAYMLNLNRNEAYNGFRDLRVILGNEFNGVIAASKMLNYSQRREKYIDLLREVMINNRLLRYDYL
jgi:Bax protein